MQLENVKQSSEERKVQERKIIDMGENFTREWSIEKIKQSDYSIELNDYRMKDKDQRKRKEELKRREIKEDLKTVVGGDLKKMDLMRNCDFDKFCLVYRGENYTGQT